MSENRKMIDKELYRKAYQLYQQRSEEKKLERAQLASRLSPAEAWQQYLGLWAFAHHSCPPPGEWQRKQKMEDLNRYYAHIKQFEAWRHAHGKTNHSRTT